MNVLDSSLCPPHAWLLVRVWPETAGTVHVCAGGHGPDGDWRMHLQGPVLADLLRELAAERDPAPGRIWLALDQASLLEPALPGRPCHNLVTTGRRKLVPGGKPEAVRAGAVMQGTLGVNRLLGEPRWQKLQADTPAERERRLFRDLDAFADAADYLWEHGYLRLARPAGMVHLEPGWYRPEVSPLANGFAQAAGMDEAVRVQLSPRRIDADLRHTEWARITGLEGGVAHSDAGDYPLEAVYGLDRAGSC